MQDSMHMVPKSELSHTHRFVHNHPDMNPTSPPIITQERLLTILINSAQWELATTKMYMHAHHKSMQHSVQVMIIPNIINHNQTKT